MASKQLHATQKATDDGSSGSLFCQVQSGPPSLQLAMRSLCPDHFGAHERVKLFPSVVRADEA